MRCDIFTNWSVDGKGKCGKLLCQERYNPGCALVKRKEVLLGKLKLARTEQIVLESELVG